MQGMAHIFHLFPVYLVYCVMAGDMFVFRLRSVLLCFGVFVFLFFADCLFVGFWIVEQFWRKNRANKLFLCNKCEA